MSFEEEKRRKSIAYIMRRRKRGRKVGANSGEVVAVLTPRGRGQVVFRPSGSASGWWRFMNVLAGLAIVVCSYLVFALPDLPPLGWHGGLVDQTIVWALLSLVAIVGLFACAYISLTLFRIIQSNMVHRNE